MTMRRPSMLFLFLRLFSGSGVLGSRDERPDERGEEGFPPPARVVDHLEEGEIERQLLPRDAPVGPEPGAQQRPEALQRVDVDLAEPVTILVARVLATPVTDRLVPVAPLVQAAVDAVLVGVHQRPFATLPSMTGRIVTCRTSASMR